MCLNPSSRKTDFRPSANSSAMAADAPKKDDKKVDKKKGAKEEPEELSEEDKALQDKMELLVTRCSDSELGLRKQALAAMVEEIRTSTSSMTSVPKPLKFLRPHFATLTANYELAKEDEAKHMLADVLSLLVRAARA